MIKYGTCIRLWNPYQQPQFWHCVLPWSGQGRKMDFLLDIHKEDILNKTYPRWILKIDSLRDKSLLFRIVTALNILKLNQNKCLVFI